MKRKRKSEKPIRYEAQDERRTTPFDTETLAASVAKDKFIEANETKMRKLAIEHGTLNYSMAAAAAAAATATTTTTVTGATADTDADEVLDLSINKAAKSDSDSVKSDEANPNDPTASASIATPTHAVADDAQRQYDLSNWILNAVRQTQLNSLLRSQMNKLPHSVSVN